MIKASNFSVAQKAFIFKQGTNAFRSSTFVGRRASLGDLRAECLHTYWFLSLAGDQKKLEYGGAPIWRDR